MSPVLTQHVSQPITLDEQTQKMKQHLLQDIRRSAYVYRVDCGGCNACEIEIFAAITPVFDAERFGIKVIFITASRRYFVIYRRSHPGDAYACTSGV